MTRRSINEIETTLRKAVIGAGWPLGLAEDAGRSGAWLEATGASGVRLCIEALSGPVPDPTGFRENDREAVIEEPVNALFFGPAAADRLCADAVSGTPVPLSAASVFAPLLCLPPLAEAAQQVGKGVLVSFDSVPILCLPEGVAAEAGLPSLKQMASVSITLSDLYHSGCEARKFTLMYHESLDNGIDVADTDWADAVVFAGKTMVPASESSRQAGAGAGAIDNE